MRSFVTAALVLALTSSVARADEADPPEDKSPGVAVLLSLGVTTAGLIGVANLDGDAQMLGVAAMYFGPSTGRWYAGSSGLSGLGLRALAVGMFAYGLESALQSECDDEAPCDSGPDAGPLLMIGGLGLWAGSTIADIIFAKTETDDWNRRHALKVAPTRFSSVDGSSATGFVLHGSF